MGAESRSRGSRVAGPLLARTCDEQHRVQVFSGRIVNVKLARLLFRLIDGVFIQDSRHARLDGRRVLIVAQRPVGLDGVGNLYVELDSVFGDEVLPDGFGNDAAAVALPSLADSSLRLC